jgi:putative ABC transport system ATP-binding protein
MSDKKLVQLEGVWKTYQMDGVQVDAVRGVSIEIASGEFASIMGPSGSGKSSLLHLIGCLDLPTRGSIAYEGVQVSEMTESQLTDVRCRKVGFIFQAFNLLPTLDVKNNVMLPMRLAGLSKAGSQERAEQLLDRVGLKQRSNHLPKQLSGGERQRVAIARGLANKPPLLLADEPTGNLDSCSGSEIVELLATLNREGQTTVMVTHNPDAAKYSSRIFRMRDGKLSN